MSGGQGHGSAAYWERACQFFRDTGQAELAGNYFLYNKGKGIVKIGLDCWRSISLYAESLHINEDRRETVIPFDDAKTLFKNVETQLNEEAPCFFLISPDINRNFFDPNLPKFIFTQPSLEFEFSSEQQDGQISYARDAACERRGLAMLRSLRAKPPPPQPDYPDRNGDFAETSAGWIAAEDDEHFLKRLETAVRVLADHPEGKMTLTRSFRHELSSRYDPLRLYELHAGMNGDYAFSHYFCIRDGVFSLGATPENVVELDGRAVMGDAVAGTCKASSDEQYLAWELYENPKQIKEHKSSLASRQNRIRSFCVDGSIHISQEMSVRTLRNVCHLYSVFSGELLPDVSIFDLMGNMFPLLGARPKELLPIADSEPAPHRYYGGLVGHLHRQTSGCFLNIRNALLVDGTVHAKVGTGVIKESDAYSELIETRNKLSGLLESIHLWENFHRTQITVELLNSDLETVSYEERP